MPPAATPDQGCAWITGASSGIGRAVARRLLQDGWRVAGTARSVAALQEMAAASAGRFTAVPADVTDRAAIAAAVAEIESHQGSIALAILNAGTFVPDAAEGFSAAAIRNQIDVNLMGTAHCLEALLPPMIQRRRGQIAIVSSVAGYRGLPRAIGYGATKAALIRMAESLKFDGDRLGIKIQVVNPGFVRTPLTDKNDFPMPMIIEAEDAADRLVRGLAGAAFEIAFPRRFAFLMRQLAALPYGLYFPVLRRITGQ